MKYFPSWRYHKNLEPKLVKDEQEDLALGKDWKHSPAAFDEIKEEKEGHGGPIEKAPAKSELFKKTVKELQEMAAEKGISKKDIKGKKEAELVAMIEAVA